MDILDKKQYIDLFELQQLSADALEEAFPGALWVRAEISEVSVKSNGHCYLELSQSDASGTLVAKAHAVIWRSRYRVLMPSFVAQTGQTLAAGMEILLLVQPSYSPLWGFTLTVEDLDGSFVVGRREIQRRQTIGRLEAEGLMGLQKELCLPVLPYRLAVISASGAAGLGDFRKHLLENEYGFALKADLFEAVMQGSAAPSSIIAAISEVISSGVEYDALLILRGGGSELDLACFDDYDLAVAIARSPLPVFTAIGHERDVHVADMVANTFVKTPTALADLFLDCYISEDQRIISLEAALRTAFSSRLASAEAALVASGAALRTAALGRLANEQARVGVLEARISALDPEAILSRGFSLAADASGVRISSVAGRTRGDKISVLLSDGRLECTVDSVRPA